MASPESKPAGDAGRETEGRTSASSVEPTSASSVEPTSASSVESRKHPVRKWLLRAVAGLLILLLLLALVVQIVLWTSFPKSVVVSQVEQGLGLRIGVNSLSTGWFGHTTLQDVKLALPLSDQSFLEVPKLKVSHTNLLGLVLGWPIRIKSIELDKPVVHVRQNSAGRWNLQEVAELIARAAGKENGNQTAQTSATAALPSVRIAEMTIVVTDNRGREVRVEPVNVTGAPETPVSWKYDVEVPSQQKNAPPHLSLLGRVAPGGTWAHEATLWVHDIAQWVQPWKPGFRQTVGFDGHWSGQLTQTGVHGFLQISDAVYGDYHASGALNASRLNGVVSIAPDHLVLRTPLPAVEELRVPAGALSYDGTYVRLTQVQLVLLGGPANVNGWYEPALRHGALEASWQNLTLPINGVKHSGKLSLTYNRPVAGPMNIGGNLAAKGTSSQGPFEAVADFGAEGADLENLIWHVDTPTLAWYRAQQIILNGLSARGTYAQDAGHRIVRLDSLSLPADNRLAGRGSYELSNDHPWELHLQGRDWPVHLIEGTQLAFGLDATGKTVPGRDKPSERKQYVALETFFLRSGEANLSVNGTYDGREPKPVKADVAFLNHPESMGEPDGPSLVHGTITGHAHLAGDLALQNKTDIAITGFLDSPDAMVLGRPIGKIHALVLGHIDNQQAILHADGIPFLGGTWNLGGAYTIQQGRKFPHTDLTLAVKDLPLPRVTEFLKVRQADGVFNGQWSAHFPGLKPVPRQITMTGDGTIRGLAAGLLTADEVSFKTSLDDGEFKIDPVTVRHGNYGRIDASAQLALSQWRQVHAAVNFTAFPVNVPAAGLGLQLWGGTNQIDLFLPDARAQDPAARKLRVDSNINLRTVVAINQQPEGEVRALASLQGRTFHLRELHGDLLGGTVTAVAVSDMDRITESKAIFAWKDIQSDRFVRLFPQLKGFGGTFAGTARLQPAAAPRPLEPLSLDIHLQSAGAHWRTVQLGNAELHAFLGPHRLIAASEQPSTIYLGGGAVDVWFSSSDHVNFDVTPGGQTRPTGLAISNQLNLTLRTLEIDQFVRAFDPTHRPGFGRLGGSLFLLSTPETEPLSAVARSITATPPPTATTISATTSAPAAPHENFLQQLLQTTTLDGNIVLGDSDLGNFGPIAFLYNAMRLGQDVRTPTGHGSIALRMERGRLHVSHLYYFNRGIEVRAVATVDKVWNAPDSPLHGSAVGTARPLKDIRLPLFAEADAILTGLQGTLTSIEFDHTLRNPGNYKLISLNDLGEELRGILLGEVGTEHRK